MEAGTAGILRCVPIFRDLDERQMLALVQKSRRRRFPAGEALFHEGDPGHTLYVVISGKVRIESTAPSGESVFIADCGPGEMFGELSLIDGRPRMADAVTAEPAELLMLERGEFLRVVEESPRIAISVMSCLAERLRRSADHVEEQQGLDVTGRLCRALLELMTHDGARRVVRASQRQLAERIGVTRETVNRSLTGLRQVGALATEGRVIVVLKPEQLQRYGQVQY